MKTPKRSRKTKTAPKRRPSSAGYLAEDVHLGRIILIESALIKQAEALRQMHESVMRLAAKLSTIRQDVQLRKAR